MNHSDAEHEARHVCATWFLSARRVGGARIGRHADEQGIVTFAPEGPDLGVADLVVALVGWMGDPDLPPNAVWPEPWPVRPDAPESIGVLVRALGLTEEGYRQTCQLAQELVEEPTFKRAVALVARGLSAAPMIDAEGLELLREAAGVPQLEGSNST